LERVKSQLRLVPAAERDEFLLEIRSHLYEAYKQTPGEDDVARILTVLRNLGEPAEVVSDRLPRTMVRSGAKRTLPLYVVGGILIALFGIPLGFGGVAALGGLLLALTGVVAAFYATAGGVVLVGGVVLSLGLTRILLPDLFDFLVARGFIQINGPPGELFDRIAPSDQGLLLILLAGVLAASGLGMMWLGTYLVRGLRFLFSLAFDGMHRLAQRIRRKLRQHPFGLPASEVSFVSNHK